MKITRRQLRRIIKEVRAPGSWPEFIELVQTDGDWENWLAELFAGPGISDMLTREMEDEFFMLGQEGIPSELDYSWKAIQSGEY